MECGCGHNDDIAKHEAELTKLLYNSYENRSSPEGVHSLFHPKDMSDDILYHTSALHHAHGQAINRLHNMEPISPARNKAIAGHERAMTSLAHELMNNYNDDTGENTMFISPVKHSKKINQQGKKMATFNSKKANTKKYNSSRYASSDNDAPLRLLFDRGDPGRSQHDLDPDYTWGRTRGFNVADHYLNGCNCNTYDNKKYHIGSYKDHGLKEPSETAIDVLGLYKVGNQWRSDKNRNKLSRTRSLGDYLAHPIKLSEPSWNGKVPNNMKFQDLLMNPLIHIGYHSDGSRRLAGHYDDPKGTGNVYFAHPYDDLQDAKHLRDLAYSNLVFNKKSENPVDYWNVTKAITRLVHGDPKEGGGYEGIVGGKQPLFLHTKLNGVLRNWSNRSVPNIAKAKSVDHAEGMKDVHADAKTASFVMCHCPACAFDDWAHGTNQVFDVQHHVRAAKSKPYDPALHEAYFSDGGHHVNAWSFKGSKDVQRLSELGQTGKMTPHRTWWPTKGAVKFIKKAVQGVKDLHHFEYEGLSTTMPVGVKKFDPEMLKELSGKSIIDLPSPYDD